MKAIQTLAACTLLLSGFAHAAPAYNGTVKGTVDGKQIDVKVVCERSKVGQTDWLQVMSDPASMGNDVKDRNGDGIALSVNVDMGRPGVAFTVLVGERVYKFGKSRGLKLSPTGLSIKEHFTPPPNKPELTAFDVDLTVDCP